MAIYYQADPSRKGKTNLVSLADFTDDILLWNLDIVESELTGG